VPLAPPGVGVHRGARCRPPVCQERPSRRSDLPLPQHSRATVLTLPCWWRLCRLTANITTAAPTRPERDLSPELDEEAPPSPSHDHGRLYSYDAQACSYPLFFGLDSTSCTERSASISVKLTEEKRAILWASKNLRTVSDLLLASRTALRTTLSHLRSGIRQNALNEVIAGLPLSVTNALDPRKGGSSGYIRINDPALPCIHR